MMQHEQLTIALAFIEGLALILSPCILPILPIILSGSLEGKKDRPIGIIAGFVVTFAVFTLFSRKLVEYSGIDLSLARNLSLGILLLLGFIMLSSRLTERFSIATNRFANVGSTFSTANNTQGGFWSGLLFGGLVGLIWTPCAGPILAAVIVQSATQSTSFSSFLVILAFGVGAGIPMLLIALFGRSIMARITFFKTHSDLIRKLLGLLIIASVLFMVYTNTMSNPSFSAITTPTGESFQTSLVNGIMTPYPAPALPDNQPWINSSPLTLESLKGKVVLIDFWTYSCINCVRTLPYLKDWYQKYHDKGLVIIGVHTPEFEFEKNIDNIKRAVTSFGLHYPITVDNQYATWQAFHNLYWPAHYLINKEGNVVYEHFGEGEYHTTENNIRFLLGLDQDASNEADNSPSHFSLLTPETYLGYARANQFAGSPDVKRDGTQTYAYAVTLEKNQWSLVGDWKVSADSIENTSRNASIKLNFQAKNVYVVMGSKDNRTVHVQIKLNDKTPISEQGKDLINNTVTVDSHKLYEVISLPTNTHGSIELTADEQGLEIYTFTFGD